MRVCRMLRLTLLGEQNRNANRFGYKQLLFFSAPTIISLSLSTLALSPSNCVQQTVSQYYRLDGDNKRDNEFKPDHQQLNRMTTREICRIPKRTTGWDCCLVSSLATLWEFTRPNPVILLVRQEMGTTHARLRTEQNRYENFFLGHGSTTSTSYSLACWWLTHSLSDMTR